jgi:hypothetical protein
MHMCKYVIHLCEEKKMSLPSWQFFILFTKGLKLKNLFKEMNSSFFPKVLLLTIF